MIEVQVGKPIPLTLQVYDSNDKLNVTAILYDKDSKEFARAELKSVSMGLYGNFEMEMPDAEILVAQYHTNSDDYEVAQDIFRAVPKPIPPEKILVAEVVDEAQWDDEDLIIGVANAEEENQDSDEV